MKITREKIVVVILINLFMFSVSMSGVIKWVGISNQKAVASLVASAIFLFFILSVIKRHYSLLFGKK